MSGHIQQPGDYWSQNQQQQYDSYNFEMPAQQDFQQELNFQSFDSASSPPSNVSIGNESIYGSNPYLNPAGPYATPMGDIYTPTGPTGSYGGSSGGEEFADEPPLLEELGINPEHIVQKDLQKYLDESSAGVLYFSLGTNVKCFQLPEDKLQKFLDAFSVLPYNVLWKCEDDYPDKPSNILIQPWFPQQDVLGHHNVKLFISQGGIQSIDEAIHNLVPILGVPLFSDQSYNVKRLQTMGGGLYIDFADFTKEELVEKIWNISTLPKYKKALEKLKDLAIDQPMPSLEKAMWWIEYVLRHNGAKHLQYLGATMAPEDFFMADVLIILWLIWIFSIYMTYLVCRKIPYIQIFTGSFEKMLGTIYISMDLATEFILTMFYFIFGGMLLVGLYFFTIYYYYYLLWFLYMVIFGA